MFLTFPWIEGISEILSRVKKLGEQMATFSETLDSLKAVNSDLETNVGKIEARITELQGQLSGGGTGGTGTEDPAQVQALQAEIDRLKAVNQRLISATSASPTPTPTPADTGAPALNPDGTPK